MKRFLSLMLAALMLLGCASAIAETTRYEEMGMEFDFDAIAEKAGNYPFLLNYGIVQPEPFVANMSVGYSVLPPALVETVDDILDTTKDEAEYNDYLQLLKSFTAYIAEIIVTDAPTLEEAIVDENILACERTEFATFGDYHYFFVMYPLDKLFTVFDEAEDTGDYEKPPKEMKADILADIETVRSELLKLLQSAERFTPVNKLAEYVGQVIEFESVDLDGNVVSSADLFKDNEITMVNVWGTWCGNCLKEMGALGEIHRRIREKGCGVVGVEYERDPIENVADTARKVLADSGIDYPNVIMPKGHPIFDTIRGYPYTYYVDREGRILTYPIRGSAEKDYEPILDKLLAGEAIEKTPESGAAENESGEYRVVVYDNEGNPVKGVIVQLCDESTCSFQKTNAEGVATFQVEAPKVYDVHVGKVPEGYRSSDETYKTLNTFSDMDIFISKAE